MPDLTGVRVFCDEPADHQLFNRIKQLSPALSQISEDAIKVYPQARIAKKSPVYKTIFPLFEHDRPDYIFTLDGKPILVVEVTEHAYTGDNGLQRFARVAAAAENGVPFIYFGPSSRVRDDELDRAEDVAALSKRSLTSDFFEGMRALHKRFGVPQLFCEWITAQNGKVKKVPVGGADAMYQEVYGHLVRIIEAVVVQMVAAPGDLHALARVCDIADAQAQLYALADNKNTLFSDVRFRLGPDATINMIRRPEGILGHMGKKYFFKGKPDKLLSMFALQRASVQHIRMGGKVISDQRDVQRLLDRIAGLPRYSNGSIGYFSGYKWRSDPHCGVAINIYYRECMNGESELPLLLFYPRISVNAASTERLVQAVGSGEALPLFRERYNAKHQEKFNQVAGSRDLYHQWTDSTKQGRIFREYCDMVFCNDGIVVGKRTEKLLS